MKNLFGLFLITLTMNSALAAESCQEVRDTSLKNKTLTQLRLDYYRSLVVQASACGARFGADMVRITGATVLDVLPVTGGFGDQGLSHPSDRHEEIEYLADRSDRGGLLFAKTIGGALITTIGYELLHPVSDAIDWIPDGQAEFDQYRFGESEMFWGVLSHTVVSIQKERASGETICAQKTKESECIKTELDSRDASGRDIADSSRWKTKESFSNDKNARYLATGMMD